jgi:hypothetical protein
MASHIKSDDEKRIVPVEIRQAMIEYTILGLTPLLYNSISSHVIEQALISQAKKTAAEKAITLRHEPLPEYQRSVYARLLDETGPTRLLAPCRWFKAALVSAAKRSGGATGAELKQLCWVEGDYTDVYGVPQIHIGPEWLGGMTHAPEARIRAIVSRWCCTIRVRYFEPQLNETGLSTLLANAGLMCGVGDRRQEKGRDNKGQFELVKSDDPRVKALKHETMKMQDTALRAPTCFDEETQRLLEYYSHEVTRRQMQPKKDRKAMTVVESLAAGAAVKRRKTATTNGRVGAK